MIKLKTKINMIFFDFSNLDEFWPAFGDFWHFLNLQQNGQFF